MCEDPRRQQGAPLEERAGTRQTLGATEGTSGGAGVSHAAATEKRGSVKTAKRNARRKGERHRRQAAKAGGAAEAADVGGAADVDEANDGGAAEAAGVGGAADEDAFPTQVDESNICQLIAQALVLKFQYLLANEGMLFKTCDGNSITVGQLIDLGMKALGRWPLWRGDTNHPAGDGPAAVLCVPVCLWRGPV